MPYAGTPEESRARRREWYAKTRDARRAYAKARRATNPRKFNADDARKHRQAMRRSRLELIGLLGGACLSCGLRDIRTFEIHHAYGGGNRARKRRGSHGYLASYYRKLRMEWEADKDCLKLLCANCHAIEHWEKVNDRAADELGPWPKPE